MPVIRIAMLFVLLTAVADQAHAGELAASAAEVRPLLLGSAMPDVALQAVDGKPVSLKRQVDGKPAILVFYRGGWCPYCNLQLSELRLITKDAEALGYQMIAISPDRPEELARTLTKDKLDYTLLSDAKADALRAFGIGFRVDDATIREYLGYGIDLEKASGQSHHALPVPSVFIVDANGILQFSYTHPDYKVRVPGSVVMAAAKAIAERKQYLKPGE
jgi:peroxiredoxin